MNWLNILGNFIGGIGLFLLGMWLMTEGLKLAAGQALERILGRWTKTHLRGLAAGTAITALVQSSSAVTVATIGFVNAGILTLGQAVWVIFGSNLGTTATGWLVALIGFKIKVEAFALPLLGLGMLMRLTGEKTRRGAYGTAVAGFGTLFLGIEVLKNAFGGFSGVVDIGAYADHGLWSMVVYVLLGTLLTVLMMSSSASTAMALTAAGSGAIPINMAAAVVIGANIGTSVKAIVAGIGATPNAKRAAAAHVLFNLSTGVVALLLLPLLLWGVYMLRDLFDLEAAPAVTLALFHSVFNVLGIFLMWPVAGRLIEFLQRRFRVAEEDEARPQYLDENVAQVPALAIDALRMELRRVGNLALGMAQRVMRQEPGHAERLARERQAIDRLTIAIGEFAAHLSRASMSKESSERLPTMLRVSRYYDAVADLAEAVLELSVHCDALPDPTLRESEEDLKQDTLRTLVVADTARADHDLKASEAALRRFESGYAQYKSTILQAGAEGRLGVVQMDAHLRRASMIRRMVQQAVKAAQWIDQGIKAGMEHEP